MGRLAVVLGIGVLLFGWAVATSTSSIQKKSPLTVKKQLALAKAATARYRNVAEAEADGYHTVPGPDGKPVCVQSMGIHYESSTLMANNGLNLRRPEMLVYAPQPDGSLRLVALEYFRADLDQSPATAGDRPRMFRRLFDGPMDGHYPGMPIHYDLHVWVWQKNELGTFASFNPGVSCPA
jgi:hypothetical protein